MENDAARRQFRDRGFNAFVSHLAMVALFLYCVVRHIYSYNVAIGVVNQIDILDKAYLYFMYLSAALACFGVIAGAYGERRRLELLLPALFLLMAFLVVFFNQKAVLSYRDDLGRDVTATNVYYLIHHALFLFLGFSLRAVRRYSKVLYAGFALLALDVFVNIDPITMLINLNVKGEESEGIYLLLGDTFAIWSLICLAVVERKFVRVVITIVAISCLFLLNSRAALYSFLIVVPFIFKASFKSTLLGAILLSLAIGIGTVYFDDVDGPVARMLTSVATGEDSSLNSRAEQFDVGLTALMDNWVVGDYAGQVREFGSLGAYMHNVLSYWQQFGFVPFILFCLIWFRVGGIAFPSGWRLKSYLSAEGRAQIYIFVFLTFQLITSRSYVSSLPWFLIGMGIAAVGPAVREKYYPKCDAR